VAQDRPRNASIRLGKLHLHVQREGVKVRDQVCSLDQVGVKEVIKPVKGVLLALRQPGKEPLDERNRLDEPSEQL